MRKRGSGEAGQAREPTGCRSPRSSDATLASSASCAAASTTCASSSSRNSAARLGVRIEESTLLHGLSYKPPHNKRR
jgi:hypothetical protein